MFDVSAGTLRTKLLQYKICGRTEVVVLRSHTLYLHARLIFVFCAAIGKLGRMRLNSSCDLYE